MDEAGVRMVLGENFIETETALIALSGPFPVGTQKARLRVALACGYLDSRYAVTMRCTHGLPLAETALWAAKHGLRMDYGGIRVWLQREGKDLESIDLEIQECRELEAFA